MRYCLIPWLLSVLKKVFGQDFILERTERPGKNVPLWYRVRNDVAKDENDVMFSVLVLREIWRQSEEKYVVPRAGTKHAK